MKYAAIALLALVPALSGQSLNLSFADNGPIRAGNSVTVNVTLAGASGQQLAAYQGFPRSTVGGTFTSLDGPAAIAAGKQSACAIVTGELNCLTYGMNATAIMDGLVQQFKLTIPSNAVPGQASISLITLAGASAAGDAIALSSAPLVFTLASPLSRCDLDGSGTTDVADVQIAFSQVVGLAPCSSDLNGDGKCTVVDLARVVTAALGGACKVSP